MNDTTEVLLTKDGYELKQQQLEDARRMLHEEIPQRIQRAKTDDVRLQENQAFLELQEQRDYYERQVRYLEALLNRATVIDEAQVSSETVGIGTCVIVKDLDHGEQLEFDLVDPAEADLESNKISIASPLGEALAGREAETLVELETPHGTVRYQILGIERSGGA